MNADKERKIEYESVPNARNKNGRPFMKFKNLGERPRLNDIKYIILMTLKHFKDTNNQLRYDETRQFLIDVIGSTRVDEDLNKYIEE